MPASRRPFARAAGWALALFALGAPLAEAADVHDAPVPAAAPQRRLSAPVWAPFAQEHRRYDVLPAPFFEPAPRSNYLDLAARADSFLAPNTPWYLEVSAGGQHRRLPALGAFRQNELKTCLDLGEADLDGLDVRLFAAPAGEPPVLVARAGCPHPLPQRFSPVYLRGPRAQQAACTWGEDGLSLVLIQGRHPTRFENPGRPVLYVGGDFKYQRVEGIVRFLRSHGVDAYGFRPSYERDLDEPLEAMLPADYAELRQWMTTFSPGGRAHLVGLCLGGLEGRGLAYLDAKQAEARAVASVTSIGTPHEGSLLADYANAFAPLTRPLPESWGLRPYKDAREAIARFNAQVPPPQDVPHGSVTLDLAGHHADRLYRFTEWPLKWLHAQETGVSPAQVPTDGLILVEGQRFGRDFGTWQCGHMGMINDGESSRYFDAYTAHEQLVRQVLAQSPREPGM